jgi:transposase
MMGQHEGQKEMFSYAVNLDRRVRANNPLRQVKEQIDFRWVREEVKDCYGSKGHVSLDPEIILKLMFLLFWDNISSERELMRIVGERLDYLWFLDYGLDDPIPDHSVLSKARARWGRDVFEQLFIRTVQQCVKEGLVGGKVIHMDGTLVVANASKDSIIKGPEELIRALKQAYGAQEKKLEGNLGQPYYRPENGKLMSKTDPDAPVISRNKPGAKGDPRPCYKNHRAVDDQEGVITAVETNPGDVEENAKMLDLVQQHESNTGIEAETTIADAQYGTIDNFRKLQQQGYETHMAILHGKQRKDREGFFSKTDFEYHPDLNRYQCPAGQWLYPRRHDPRRQATEYHTRKGTCANCLLKSKCTTAKNGRTIMRHDGQEFIDQGHLQANSAEAKKNRVRRRWLMEGSFGQATEHHIKRSHYRRLWRQQIQDFLIAAVQNIKKIITRRAQPGWGSAPEARASGLGLLRSFNSAMKPTRAPKTPITFRLAQPSVLGALGALVS